MEVCKGSWSLTPSLSWFQMELEKSMLSDHELRLLEDAERMSRKQAGDYDSDDEDGHGHHEIMLAQDLDDAWEQKMKSFQPSQRVRGQCGGKKRTKCVTGGVSSRICTV